MMQYTLNEIHNAFLQSKSLTSAAKLLNINFNKLYVYLVRLLGLNDGQKNLTERIFFTMASMDIKTAEQRWGKDYYTIKAIDAPNAETLTPRMIHQAAQKYNSKNAAAMSLGLNHTKLTCILKELFPDSELINFSYWHNLSEEDALDLFDEQYDEPISTLGYIDIVVAKKEKKQTEGLKFFNPLIEAIMLEEPSYSPDSGYKQGY